MSCNIIVCVATYNSPYKIEGFFREIMKCHVPGELSFLVLNTGNPFEYEGIAVKQLDPKPRIYGEVVLEKINYVREYADDDSVVWFADDDYAMNPYALLFLKKVMEENQEIDYISMLREPNTEQLQPELKLFSGFRFYRYPSCMGGAFTVRWKNFVQIADSFFKHHGTDHYFDQIYWKYLYHVCGLEKVVYTTFDFSLIQHCQYGSAYGHNNHMYGTRYDNRCNPFDLQEKS